MRLDLSGVSASSTSPQPPVGFHRAVLNDVGTIFDNGGNEVVSLTFGIQGFSNLKKRLSVMSPNEQVAGIAKQQLKTVLTICGVNPNTFDSKNTNGIIGGNFVVLVSKQKNDDRYVEISRFYEDLSDEQINELRAANSNSDATFHVKGTPDKFSSGAEKNKPPLMKNNGAEENYDDDIPF